MAAWRDPADNLGRVVGLWGLVMALVGGVVLYLRFSSGKPRSR
ncbi:hypothetical protein GCM10025862_41250 [Arsenicicoccus piscis]|uniref:LPXTG cell wall anchor domain-containing protein n=1 Tax=Arsenicicoccus piscis TaxID=673954 RepID=A0ABQ6HHK1_9MICO|nr:hypothetical protein GCM10025862_01200 [Arsenicicoccus piscis]GMA22102.1 hypothetical protein GCM10025862_41250 [Arsenicicoccus piscis]